MYTQARIIQTKLVQNYSLKIKKEPPNLRTKCGFNSEWSLFRSVFIHGKKPSFQNPCHSKWFYLEVALIYVCFSRKKIEFTTRSIQRTQTPPRL